VPRVEVDRVEDLLPYPRALRRDLGAQEDGRPARLARLHERPAEEALQALEGIDEAAPPRRLPTAGRLLLDGDLPVVHLERLVREGENDRADAGAARGARPHPVRDAERAGDGPVDVADVVG